MQDATVQPLKDSNGREVKYSINLDNICVVIPDSLMPKNPADRQQASLWRGALNMILQIGGPTDVSGNPYSINGEGGVQICHLSESQAKAMGKKWRMIPFLKWPIIYLENAR